MRGKVEIRGEEAGVGSGSAGLVCIRGSPRDVRRKGEKRSWQEGEDRREAEGEGGSFQGKWPRPPPGAVRMGRDGRESRRRAGSGA